MSTSFLAYWKPETVDQNLEPVDPAQFSASEQYWRVKAGDTVWIATVRHHDMRLVGRIKVGLVTNRRGAAKALKALGESSHNLWNAKYFIIAKRGSAEPLREVQLRSIASKLRFESATRPALKVLSGHVNPQQLQTMRILTSASDALLDSAWGAATATRRTPSRKKVALRADAPTGKTRPEGIARMAAPKVGIVHAVRPKAQIAPPKLVLPQGRYTLFKFGEEVPPEMIAQLAGELLTARKPNRRPGAIWVADIGQLWMGPRGPVVRFSPAVPSETLDEFQACLMGVFDFRRVRAQLREVVLERSQALAWFQDDLERVWPGPA